MSFSRVSQRTVGPEATVYVVDPTRAADVAAGVLGWDYAGALIHDGWAAYDRFLQAAHQQCLAHPLRRCRDLLEAATRGAVRFPRAVRALLQAGLELRDRHAAGEVSDHGLAVARGRLVKRLELLAAPPKTNAAMTAAMTATAPKIDASKMPRPLRILVM